jgi:hypothetical protein
MNKAALLFISLLASGLAWSQNNVLLLQKNGRTKQTFFPGRYISLQTIQGNYADGLITRITSDSIFIRHFDIQQSVTDFGGVYFDTAFRYTTAIHYKDVGAIMQQVNNSARKRNGNLLLIAGGGVMALGAINGLYRGDPPRDWYKPSGYISAGALTSLGLLMKKSARQKTKLGKRHSIKILPLNPR